MESESWIIRSGISSHKAKRIISCFGTECLLLGDFLLLFPRKRGGDPLEVIA